MLEVSTRQNTANPKRNNKKKLTEEDLNLLHLKNISEIITILIENYEKRTKVHLHTLISETTRKNKVPKAPKLVEIISAIPENYKAKLTPLLKAKPVRTASGIAVVAVMCKPHRCPHIATTGNICIYCPGGPDSDFEYSTQSYTGYEPTSMRAIRARYNPYIQTRDRVEQLKKIAVSLLN